MTRLRDSTADFRALIAATSRASGMPSAFVEKDYWITELLRSVATPVVGPEDRPEPVVPIFKGGTSLSKAFGLISRFSEDVDVLLDAPTLGAAVRDRILKEIGRRAARDLGVGLREREKDRGVKRNFEYEVPRLHVSAVISPRVRLEMGFRGGPQPNERRTMTSYVAEHAARAFRIEIGAYDELTPVSIAVLEPLRTLVEKLMCLHAAARRADEGDPAELVRCVRHYYDVGRLLESRDVMGSLASHEGGTAALAADVHAHSLEARFPSCPRPDGGFARSSAFRPGAPWESELRSAYEAALPQLVWGECPTLDACLNAVRERASAL